ncbi:hypothetical protein [Mesorhizobium sp. CO1-1-3]|uniref:hypothetical protein n=1 Tax=unclassified Mesorhizobium TaxID=325217 RepID=UPI00398C954A
MLAKPLVQSDHYPETDPGNPLLPRKGTCAIAHFSIWQSTASCAGAIWSDQNWRYHCRCRRADASHSGPAKDRPTDPFELTSDVRSSRLARLERRSGTVADYVFPSRIDHSNISALGSMLDQWTSAHRHCAAPGEVRHALASTNKGGVDLPATGNIRAIQILLGHTNIENTVRYLGVDRSSRSARKSEIRNGRSAVSDDRPRCRRNRAATAIGVEIVQMAD